MILKDLPCDVEGAVGDTVVTGLTADSRHVRPGFIFFALQGTVHDGRHHIRQAVQAGASVVIGEDLPTFAGVQMVEVPNARLTLARMAACFYPAQPESIIAVTGTNGKSSTADFLRQIWENEGHKAASIGTLGIIGSGCDDDLGHTTPDPVTMHASLHKLAGQGVTHVAMEASSHGLAQYRMDAVNLSGVAFTNLTRDHLDYHEGMNDYRAAKLRLFAELAPTGCPAVINADAETCLVFEEAAQAASLGVVSVGWRGRDLKIGEMMPRTTGQSLFVTWRGERQVIDLPLIGEFQALNALMAAALALSSGSSLRAVTAAMARLKPIAGRFEHVGQTPSGAGVFVDYAHTPTGIEVLLRAARPHTPGRLVVVFGCGGDRDRDKRAQMGAIAARHADTVIVTSDNPRTEDPDAIIAAIMAGAPGARAIPDRGEAIFQGVAGLAGGDTLLIAGKGHETGQTIGDETIPFSDQDVAARALQACRDG